MIVPNAIYIEPERTRTYFVPIRPQVPIEVRQDRHRANRRSFGAIGDSVTIRVRSPGGRPGREEDPCARDQAGPQAVIANGDLPRSRTNHVREGQVRTDEAVGFRQVPRPRGIEEEMDPLSRLDDLRAPGDPETLEHLDESAGGERHRPSDRVDANRGQIARGRPGGEVASG